MLAFLFFVLSGWGSLLYCCYADINTTYNMGTAALRCRLFLLLLVLLLHFGWGLRWPIFRLGVGVMLPILLLLVLLLHYG